jgi:Domain of unknown function (DUF4402)
MHKSFVFKACCLAWALHSGVAFAQTPVKACNTVEVQTLSDLNFGTLYFARGREGRVIMQPNGSMEALSAGVALPLAPNHSPGMVRIKGPANSLIHFSLSNPVTRSIQVDQIKLIHQTQQREIEKRGEFWVVSTKNLPSVELNIVGTLGFSGLTRPENFITTFSVSCEFVQDE